MITCWEVLDIDETDSLKDIKSAYAKKLKFTRPEDDKEAFQQLSEAYKYALYLAKEKITKNISVEQVKKVENTNEIAEQNTVSHNVELSEEQQIYQDKAEKEYQKLKAKIEETIHDDLVRNSLSFWSFITKSEYILDPHFNQQLGLFVLSYIDEYNQKNIITKRRKGHTYRDTRAAVKADVLVYLDSIFAWSSQFDMVIHYLGEDIAKRLYKDINSQSLATREDQLLQSVKGGVIKKQHRANQSGEEKVALVLNAYDNVVKLSSFALVINFIACLALVAGSLSKGDMIITTVGTIAGFITAILFFGIRSRKKAAFFGVWIYAFVLVSMFPIGTIVGVLLLINLYRARNFHTSI
ncbi:J domain-containing protein [Thalassotalea ganghwensis]